MSVPRVAPDPSRIEIRVGDRVVVDHPHHDAWSGPVVCGPANPFGGYHRMLDRAGWARIWVLRAAELHVGGLTVTTRDNRPTLVRAAPGVPVRIDGEPVEPDPGVIEVTGDGRTLRWSPRRLDEVARVLTDTAGDHPDCRLRVAARAAARLIGERLCGPVTVTTPGIPVPAPGGGTRGRLGRLVEIAAGQPALPGLGT